MIDTVTIRRAVGAQDVQAIADLWTHASRWLRERGSDQWQYTVRIAGIEQAVRDETCWMVHDDSRLVGTITVDENAEPALWGPEDGPDNALYVHRMVVARSAKGVDLGCAMLDWAGRHAQGAGKTWLRLDAWTTNTRLHQYYLDREFELVRVVPDADPPSGACFQRAADVQLNCGPRILETNADGTSISSR